MRQEEAIITSTCLPDTAEEFVDESKKVAVEIEELRSGLERLTEQLNRCLSFWDRHTAALDNVSSKLAELEERLRLDFKLQPTFEQKVAQVTKAEV